MRGCCAWFSSPQRVFLAGGIVLFLVMGISALTSSLPTDGDSSSYISLAQSLAQGRGYLNTIYPGDLAETQYPPLLPLLLSPLIVFFGRNYLVLKLIPLAFGTAALIAIFTLLRRRICERWAIVITLLTGLNPYYLGLATSILTETAYLFFSAYALVVVDRIGRSKWNLGQAIGASLLIAAAFYTRTIGISLLGASFLVLIRRGLLKPAVFLAISQLVLIGWWGWWSYKVSNSYIYYLLEYDAGISPMWGLPVWFARILQNIPPYAGKVMADLIGGPIVEHLNPYQPGKIIPSLLLFLLFLVGFVRDLWQGISTERLYLLIYLGIFAVWPYHAARFLVPVLPFVFLHMLSGVKAVVLPWPAVIRHQAQYSMAALLGIAGLIGCVILIHHNRTSYYYPEMSHYREACLWIKAHTPAKAVVLCRKPRIAALWSDRKAWWCTDVRDTAEFIQNSRSLIASHLLINDFEIVGVNLADQFASLLTSYPQYFRLVYQTAEPRILVYEIHLEDPEVP